MYRSEHYGYTMVFPRLHFSSMKLPRELFRYFIESCDHVNRAVADGKALDQLCDRLAGPFSVNDVVARGGSTRHSEELHVDVFLQNKITAADKLRIKMEGTKLNARYGSNLNIHIIGDNQRKE